MSTQPEKLILTSPPPKTDKGLRDIILFIILLLIVIVVCVYCTSAIPNMTGAIAYFPTSVPPAGWLSCNGAIVSRAKYPDLFLAIGVVFGPGDGVATFALPDLRGVFLRGLDNKAGIDAGRVLSPTAQPGTAVYANIGEARIPPSTQWVPTSNNTYNVSTDIINHEAPTIVKNTAYLGVRPINVALLACIKT